MNKRSKDSFTQLFQNRTKRKHSCSHITFRMDDICPRMNYENFLKFKQIFCKYNIKPLLGVVPDNQDENLNKDEEIRDFWVMINDLKNAGWSIAQHGHTHVYTTGKRGIFSIFPRSEFAGLPYDEQLQKIKLGKNLLKNHGIDTDIFMAPAHTLDENTLKALVECGFNYITDGRSRFPYIYRGLKFIPCRDHNFKIKTGFMTICIHANTVADIKFLALDSFIRENRDKIIDFSDALILPTMHYPLARLQEHINIIFLRHIKPIIYPVYYRIKLLMNEEMPFKSNFNRNHK